MTRDSLPTDEHPVDLLLDSALRDVPTAETERRLVQRVEAFRPPALPFRMPGWFGGAVAAILAVTAAVGFLLLGGGEQSLHAQVRAAMRQVNTIHLVATEHRPGQPVVRRESWYERGQGYHARETVGEAVRISVETRDTAWFFEPGSKLAARRKSFRSVDDLAAMGLSRLVDAERLFERKPERDAASDKRVNGKPWTCYALVEKGLRGRVWLDAQQRIRRSEASDEKTGELRWLSEADYDSPVDRKLFDFQPPQGVEVVEPRDYLTNRYPVAKALLTREMAGMVFAVHEFKRIDGRCAWMVCSTRLSDAARAALPVEKPLPIGQVSLSPAYALPSPTPVIALATAQVADVQVDWYLLASAPEGREGKADLQLSAYAGNDLEKLLKRADRPTQERLDLSLDVPAELAGIKLEDSLATLHADVRRVRPILDHAAVIEAVPNPPKTTGSLQARDPRVFSNESFTANVLLRLKRSHAPLFEE